MWHGHAISEVVDRRLGIVIGYGVVCGRHHPDNKTECKRQITDKKFSSDEIIRRLKRWILRGFEIPLDKRKDHVFLPKTQLESMSSHEDFDAMYMRCLARSGAASSGGP